jgi:3-hydroxy-3-methylglutaryl CoA synthase
MTDPLQPRRFLLGAAKKFLFDDSPAAPFGDPTDDFPRLTSRALESMRMSRSRERIMENLETMYREAFERAKASDDPAAMTTLDFAYRREQLYLELLLDIRDAAERR